MTLSQDQLRARFEKHKPHELAADIRMISGCQDTQTSADGTLHTCMSVSLDVDLPFRFECSYY
jgi:hypothetical protein